MAATLHAMKSSHALIVFVVLTSATVQAQVFTFDVRNFVHPNAADGAFFTGTAAVDPVANTAAIVGHLNVPALVHYQVVSQKTIVPGPFPHVDVYTDTLDITYHIASISHNFALPPTIPSSIGGFQYQADFPSEPFETQVNFAFRLS